MPKPLRIALAMLAGSTIFVGLPLLGWGFGDLGGFFANPARTLYVAVVIALNAYASVNLPETGKPEWKEKTIVPRQRYAVSILQVLSIAVVLGAPFCDRRELMAMAEGNAFRFVGLAAFSGGFLLMHLAEVTLGKQFTVQVSIREGHQLITSGVYSHVRHPRYLGIVFFTLGLALIFRSWLSLAITAAIAVVLLWRIGDEEAMMHNEFGKEWEIYAQRTWRLIPFIY